VLALWVWEREDTEGGPSGTQGRCINKNLDWEKVFINYQNNVQIPFYILQVLLENLVVKAIADSDYRYEYCPDLRSDIITTVPQRPPKRASTN
jgi:hypothetical protein